MKYLCLDYGRKRIGVAVSYLTLAEPLCVLENTQDIFSNIETLIREESIDALVIGISDREMAQETRQFAEQLQTRLRVPLHFFDESFSSKVAHAKVLESGKKQHDRRQPVDHFAAAHVLQEFLDTQG